MLYLKNIPSHTLNTCYLLFLYLVISAEFGSIPYGMSVCPILLTPLLIAILKDEKVGFVNLIARLATIQSVIFMLLLLLPAVFAFAVYAAWDIYFYPVEDSVSLALIAMGFVYGAVFILISGKLIKVATGTPSDGLKLGHMGAILLVAVVCFLLTALEVAFGVQNLFVLTMASYGGYFFMYITLTLILVRVKRSSLQQ